MPVPHVDDALVPGAGFEKELAGGKAYTYKISLRAAQFLRVVVEQRGIIITATLFDPGGRELVRADNASGAYGPVYVSTVSESAGDYRIEIRSNEKWANVGRYQIAIEDLRDAKPSDRALVAAEKSYADGRQFLALGKSADAAEKFEEALKYWRPLGERHWLALTEYCLGVANARGGERRAAAEHFDNSLKVEIDERDWRLRATTFNDRGVNYARMGEAQQATASLDEALRVYQSHQDRRGVASALNSIGYLYLGTGRYRDADESFRKALPLRRVEKDRFGEAVLLSNIGSAAERLGEPHEALEGNSAAVRIWQELKQSGDPRVTEPTLAAGLNNVALAYDRLGEWQKALETYEEALSLYKAAPPVEAAKTLDNIGELYAVLGDADTAVRYYDKARDFARGKDPAAEANVLSHIGQVYLSEGKAAGALAYFQRALALRKGGPEKANTLTNIGGAYVLQGNSRKALESYDLALKLSEGSEDRRVQAITLHKMGEAHLLLGEHASALEDFKRALPLWKSVADLRGEAATLHGMALVLRDQGELTEALARSRASLDIVESLRTKVASQRLRTTYFATQQNNYELYIDLRMRSYKLDRSPEHLAAMLEASEQARTRSLLDTLNEARADISRGIGEDLLKEEREAQQRLNDKARIQMELLSGRHSPEKAAEVEQEVREAIAAYDAVKAKIRVRSPVYAQLTQPHSLSLREIQQLLDEDTVLLEYFLGEEKSYLWLVSSTSVVSVELPAKRPEIDDRARAFYESLAGPQPDADEAPAGDRRRAAAYGPLDASSLSQMLLGGVADRLGKKRLVIVGDGILQYLPFCALPVPTPQAGLQQIGPRPRRPAVRPYLIEEHEIVYLPSASALSVLRAEASSRRPAPLSVAVLANPVFTADDERLKQSRQGPPASGDGSEPGRVGEELSRSGVKLVPLPATEIEALAIRDAVPPPGRTRLALGLDASRATVTRLQDEDFRVVHFATHATFNAEHPELSSVVLSMMNAEGDPEDGYLKLHDIYNLKLPADLVVLSACSTGLGTIIKGEGLVGLTRGFMYAGSPRVIASLWLVEDLGTSVLMKRFYQNMAGGGLSPAAALRKTQAEMLHGRRWRSPYYWAGFVIQGEWRGSGPAATK